MAFLDDARRDPAALIIEGEAGIGKTTLWSRICSDAEQRGYRVLAGQVGQAETVMAYAALADLLADLDPGALHHLPDVQRYAMERVVYGAVGDGPATDHHVVAAAVITVIRRFQDDGPALLAIDDTQWIDSSSRAVLALIARRARGPLGLLVSERCDAGQSDCRTWLRLGGGSEPRSVRVGPMVLGELHALLLRKLGRSFPRPVIARIADVSGGNPFFALELARSMSGHATPAVAGLPRTLAEVVRQRIGGLDVAVRDVLLAAASVATPTVDVLAHARDITADDALTLLEAAEAEGIIAIDGNRVRFAHPLLAHGLYTAATPATRRAMHRTMAAVESQPELRARHLALSATTADEVTLQALDSAADRARERGAPAAAAELLDLALGLGGYTALRALRAAGDHFRAGDTDKALIVLRPVLEESGPGVLRAVGLNLLAAIHMYDNRFSEARELLTDAIKEAEGFPRLQIQSLMSLSFAQGMGSFAEGNSVGMFDQSLSNARRAKELAVKHASPATTSRALAMWVHASFQLGHGVDEESLQEALRLEDPDDDAALPFCASAVAALIAAWTGRLEEAAEQMKLVRQRYLHRGDERNLLNVAAYSALIEMWRGNLLDATAFAAEAVERAEQLGAGSVSIIPLSVRAAVEAHIGREEAATEDALAALTLAQNCDAPRMTEWPIMTLGFLDVSRGDYKAALIALEPMLARFGVLPGNEIMHGWYLADAVEAMVASGRLEDAEPIVGALEQDGSRTGRSWMQAAGARCRGMVLAAQGALDDALPYAEQSIREYDAASMPFDRARSQLFLGQLLRRQRRREAAKDVLSQAAQTFDSLGTPLFRDRTLNELKRLKTARGSEATLTAAEHRVAQLAAAGMRNREIAAELFLSVKTVEANLSAIYRKLGIRSRTELARRFDSTAPPDPRGAP